MVTKIVTGTDKDVNDNNKNNNDDSGTDNIPTSKTNAMIDMFILETSSLLQNMIFSNYCKWDDTFLPVTSS